MYKSGVELGKTYVYILNTVEWIQFGTQCDLIEVYNALLKQASIEKYTWLD